MWCYFLFSVMYHVTRVAPLALKIIGTRVITSSFSYDIFISYRANMISSTLKTSFLRNVKEEKTVFVYFPVFFSPQVEKCQKIQSFDPVKEKWKKSHFPKFRKFILGKESSKSFLRQTSGTQSAHF